MTSLVGHPFWSTSRAILFCLDHVRSMCSHWGQAWSRKTSLHLFEDVFSNPNPTSWATECVIRLFQPELFARTCFLDTNPVSKTAHTTKIFFYMDLCFLYNTSGHISLSLSPNVFTAFFTYPSTPLKTHIPMECAERARMCQTGRLVVSLSTLHYSISIWD